MATLQACSSDFQNGIAGQSAALSGQLFCPAFIVEPFLLDRQRAPRGFHPQQGEPGLLVFGAFGKEGAVLRIISIQVGQVHTAQMGRRGPIATGIFREMFVRSEFGRKSPALKATM
jgi:hypothetical protein